MAPSKTRQWLLNSRPSDLPTYGGDNTNLKLVETDLPSLQNDQVLLKSLMLSNDPAQRGWMDDVKKLYVPPIELNTPMRARGLAEVIESKSDKFKQGDVITATVNWCEYVVMDAKDCVQAPPLPNGLNMSHYLGAFGGTGLTAYYGLVVVGEAKKGQKLVVSGAAGATGSMVVQIAKHIVGCGEIIGLAGSDEKCRWVESIGADKCLNYKDSDFEEQLEKATGGQTDIYFDNVAGEILDSMLAKMKQGGVIVACGGVSGYNDKNPTMLKHYMYIVFQRLSVRGFIVTDFLPRAKEALDIFKSAAAEGKLKIGDENEHVVPTKFEDIPKTWLMLFSGGNQGKLVTKIVS